MRNNRGFSELESPASVSAKVAAATAAAAAAAAAANRLALSVTQIDL